MRINIQIEKNEICHDVKGNRGRTMMITTCREDDQNDDDKYLL